jgi:hypothetical protein
MFSYYVCKACGLFYQFIVMQIKAKYMLCASDILCYIKNALNRSLNV